MRLVLGKDFPAVPPKGYFLTKIFHPNVGHKGEICVNVLKRDWKAELGLRHILLVRVPPSAIFPLSVMYVVRQRFSLCDGRPSSVF